MSYIELEERFKKRKKKAYERDSHLIYGYGL